MRPIINRIPTIEDLDRNKAKIGGFMAGIFGTLLLGMLIGVVYSGQSAFVAAAPDSSPVYPNF